MKDTSKLISFTTTCAMLVIMACVGLYYMQYDYDAVAYIKSFAYLVLTVSSVAALVFLKNTKGKGELAFASLAFSVIMLASSVFAIIPATGNYSTLLTYFAMAFFAPFALSFIAKKATGKEIFENIIVKAAVLVLSVVAVILFGIVPAAWTRTVLFIFAIIWALILIAGAVFAIINIIKKKSEFINWTYIFFALPYAATYVQFIINTRKYVKTCAGVAMMALALLIVALVNKTEE